MLAMAVVVNGRAPIRRQRQRIALDVVTVLSECDTVFRERDLGVLFLIVAPV